MQSLFGRPAAVAVLVLSLMAACHGASAEEERNYLLRSSNGNVVVGNGVADTHLGNSVPTETATESAGSNPYFLLVSDMHFDPLYDASQEPGTLCRDEEQFYEYMWERKKKKTARLIADTTRDISRPGHDTPDKEHYLNKLKKKAKKQSSLPYYNNKKKKELNWHAYMNDHGCTTPPCNYGRFGCDAPKSLVTSTVEYMKTLPQGPPEFIVATGDWAAHYLPTKSQTADTVRQQYSMFKTAFPGSIVVPVIGNNDYHPHYNAFCRDFDPVSDSGDDWHQILLSVWSDAIPADGHASFLRGGYYSVAVSPRIRVVVMNTIFYSVNLPGEIPDASKADPCGQLAWLESQLQAAESAGQHVVITSHIAPGMGRGELPEDTLWRQEYVEAYVGLVTRYKDLVIAQLYGHTHRDMVVRTRVGRPDLAAGTDDEPVPILYTSSISPVRNNLPAFKQVFYHPGSATEAPVLLDYTAHSASLPSDGTAAPKWRPRYSFKALYGAGGLDRVNMIKWAESVYTDDATFNRWFQERRGGFEVENIDSDAKMVYKCGTQHMDYATYHDCVYEN